MNRCKNCGEGLNLDREYSMHYSYEGRRFYYQHENGYYCCGISDPLDWAKVDAVLSASTYTRGELP